MAIINEVPAGAINGINATFTTSEAYAAGTLLVFLNGQMINKPGSIAETDPAAGVFTISDADLVPKSGLWGADEVFVSFGDGNDVAVVDLTYQGEPVAIVLPSPQIINGVIEE